MRANKLELRRAIEEEVQECYDEMRDGLAERIMFLLDDGLEGEEVSEIIEKERMLYVTLINQFYQRVK